MWQEIDERRHSCHSWQESGLRMITAMTALTLALLVLGFGALLTWVRHDRFSTQPTLDVFA